MSGLCPRKRGFKLWEPALLAGLFTLTHLGALQGGENPLAKQLHLLNWQPTQAPAGAQYAGRKACEQCHPAEMASQPFTAMAQALELPLDSQVLRSHPRLTARLGPYTYEITRENDRCTYTVSDGNRTISAPISWAVGLGVDRVGQTFVVQYHGSYYESRVSFFQKIQGLDITIGQPATASASFEDALGRVLGQGELQNCLGCHATAAVGSQGLQVSRLVPGITCEGCHGPGAAHIAAMKAGNVQEPHILNPDKLAAGDLVSFCGACHRTKMHVEAMHASGVLTVRFQPYRLAESRCYNPRDSRIACLACHNPHENPRHDPAFYDSKCLACHAASAGAIHAAQENAPACPVAKERCVTCHMPKYELAGTHFKFADHKIRVVRLGENFD